MLEGIFGNKNAERALLHVFHYGEIHASAIAKDYEISLTPIKAQLERFEAAGLLTSRLIGRSRVYALNPKSVWTTPIREILKIAYNSIPLKERSLIFQARRRPRRKGKPVL